MSLLDDVGALRADLKELEGFLDEATQDRVKELLEESVKKLKKELTEALAEEAEEAERQKEMERKDKEKKAAKKAEEEAELKKKEEKKAAEAKVPAGEAVTLPSGLIITAEAAAAMAKMKGGLGRNHKDTACITKIGADGKSFELVEMLEDASIEDIADEMTELDPRYIFYSYNKVMPDGRLKTPLVFIYYTPQKAPPKKSMAATRWKNEIDKHFQVIKTLEVRDLDDFDQEWFDSVS